MKNVITSKTYLKQFKVIASNYPNKAKRIIERLELFLHDKNNPILKDHALLGKLQGCRAFSLAGDLRIVYREDDKYYYFDYIGTHNQVY